MGGYFVVGVGMTDFTPDQLERIEAAIAAVYAKSSTGNLTAKKVITELTKPSWTPAVGEVFAYAASGLGVSNYYKHTLNGTLDETCRPLNSSEVPALKVAIEALERVVSNELEEYMGFDMLADEVLAKITELTQRSTGWSE